MVSCSSCGKELNTVSSFCPWCGSLLIQTPSATPIPSSQPQASPSKPWTDPFYTSPYRAPQPPRLPYGNRHTLDQPHCPICYHRAIGLSAFAFLVPTAEHFPRQGQENKSILERVHYGILSRFSCGCEGQLGDRVILIHIRYRL